MDDERPPRPRPARSRRPAPRPRAAPRPRPDYGEDTRNQPYRTHRRPRRRERSSVRPLHVLLLVILVIGLIGFSIRVLAGGDEAGGGSATSAVTTTGTASAVNLEQQSQTTVAATTTKAGSTSSEPTLAPLVQGRPAPTSMAGATAMANQPRLTAGSYVALDIETNQILLAYDDTQERPIASLTKMMTGLLTAEAGNLSHMVLVSPTAANVEPSKDGLIVGNRYPRGVLLYSTLLGSNNDAAAAIGEDLGNGNYQRFYRLMNRRANQLGLTNTHYASASGLNDSTNYSTARDQAIMLARALENPTFAKAVRTWRHVVRWNDTDGTRTYENHNKMLHTYRGTIGGKTGFTTIAGGCLAVAVRRGGRTIVGVILGSKDPWVDMPRLIDAAFKRAP